VRVPEWSRAPTCAPQSRSELACSWRACAPRCGPPSPSPPSTDARMPHSSAWPDSVGSGGRRFPEKPSGRRSKGRKCDTPRRILDKAYFTSKKREGRRADPSVYEKLQRPSILFSLLKHGSFHAIDTSRGCACRVPAAVGSETSTGVTVAELTQREPAYEHPPIAHWISALL